MEDGFYNRRMLGIRRLRLVTSWIAALAILVGALAPTLSHAMQRGGPDVWAAICSSTGAKWTVAAAGATSTGEDGTRQPMQTMEHCPYCAWHAPVLGLPPAALQPHLVAVAFEPLPLATLHAHRTLFAWTSAQPRAPPLVA